MNQGLILGDGLLLLLLLLFGATNILKNYKKFITIRFEYTVLHRFFLLISNIRSIDVQLFQNLMKFNKIIFYKI